MLDTDRHSSATAYDDDTVSHDPLPRHRCLGPTPSGVRISLALHPYSNEPASSFPALTLGPHRMHVPRMHVPCMHVPCMHSMHARLMHALNATVKPKNQMPRHVSPRCVHRLRARRPHPLPPYTTCTRGGGAPAPGSHHGRTGAYSGYLSRPSPLPLLFHGCARSSTQSWSLELNQPRARLRLTSNSRAYAPRRVSARRFGGAELRRLRADRRAPRAVVASFHRA